MKKNHLYIIAGLLALAVLLAFLLSNNPSNNMRPGFDKPLEPTFKKEGTLSILSSLNRDPIVDIDIEIADDAASIEVGMMYRRKMADKQGMLFIFERPKPQSFWMLNTYISLDIIYIDDTYKIVKIHKNAVPESRESLPSGKPAQYVLEVVGGFSEKFGVNEGDFVSFEQL